MICKFKSKKNSNNTKNQNIFYIQIFQNKVSFKKMRFKIRSIQTQQKHQENCTSVSWLSINELTSIGDDNIIYKWNSSTSQSTKFLQLDSFSIDHDWLITKGNTDVFAIGFIDGSFRIYNKMGKLEKNVTDAHSKSLIALKWSYDGSALATTGQDGALKIWSRNGSLRTNLVQNNTKPIYSLAWSPESDAVLYCSDKFITLKPMSANQQKGTQWKAHEGLVLKIDWCPTNNLIVSCGQDCKYKVWDSYGRNLYSSAPYDYVINSVCWSPNGEYFAIGAFGMLKLCDKTGWTYSFNKTSCGSIQKVSWSSDGTLCAGSCGSGNVVFAQVVDKQLNYSNWQANLNDQNRIVVTDILTEMGEFLDFKDRVINMSIGWSNLVVTTANQCYVYDFSNWNTPHIFDLKDSVTFISQCSKLFCLVQCTQGLMIYNYDGKLVSNPKIAGAKFEFMSKKRIAISPDVLAVIESTNPKIVRFYQTQTGKPLNFTIQHSLSITQINLNQVQQSLQRKIAFVDANKDLYISTVHKSQKSYKLGTICDSFIWHDKFDILTSISDSKLVTYFYPNVVYIDNDLLEMTILSKQYPQLGRLPQILNYSDSLVNVRRKDGGIVSLGISPYPTILFDFCQKGKLDKGLKLCRFVKEPLLWACLATICLKFKDLDTAQTAFAAIQQPQKIAYIAQIRELNSQVLKNAAMALLYNKQTQAQNIYIQNKYYFRAIKMNINSYKWDRALKLARDFKNYLDIVIGLRKKYLERIGKEQSSKDFIKASQEVGEINFQEIQKKIAEQTAKQIKK